MITMDKKKHRSRLSKSKPWKMISVRKENEIRSLLEGGETIASIVRKIGVSRDTVRRIRDSDGPRDRNRMAVSPRKRSKPYSEKHMGALNNLKTARRCPGCGAKVLLWPCLACNPNTGCY